MVFEPQNEKALRYDEPTPTVFEQYPIGQWSVAGQVYAFPVVSISESGGNRLVPRERPYRDGAKLDDTGTRPTSWRMELCFNNTLDDQSVQSINGGQPLYPTVLNYLLDSFRVHETGDLTLPTRDVVRARVESYDRVERTEEKDHCLLVCTFVEDNEDNVDAQAYTAPSINANVITVSVDAGEAVEDNGGWDGSIQDLKNFAAQVEGIANAPNTYASELEGQAKVLKSACVKMHNAHTKPWQDGRDALNDPASTLGQRKLAELLNMSASLPARKNYNKRPIETVVFRADMTLTGVAAYVGQTFEELLELNGQLADVAFIPAGTPVRIYGDG